MSETEIVSTISFAIGFAVSILAFILPDFKLFLELLDGDERRYFFAFVGMISAAITGLVTCTVGGYPCSTESVFSLVIATASAIGGSQGAYTVLLPMLRKSDPPQVQ